VDEASLEKYSPKLYVPRKVWHFIPSQFRYARNGGFLFQVFCILFKGKINIHPWTINEKKFRNEHHAPASN